MTLSTALSASPPVTDGIRPCVEDDIPGVARLFDIAFFRGPGRRLPRLEAYLADLYFAAPREAAGKLSSYIYEDASGSVGGFIGTHPRTFVLEGRWITAAAYGQLMVRPDLRGQGIARELCRRFYEGGQLFSFSTTVSRTRRIDLSLGAHNPPFYGLSWRKTLRLARAAVRRLAESRKLGPLRHVFGPFAGTACRPSPGTGCNIEELDSSEVEAVYCNAFEAAPLHPTYDRSLFKRKLDILGRSSSRPAFAGVVRDGGHPVGFFVWLLECGGRGTVLEMLAVPGYHDFVLAGLLTHARQRGAESIGGFCSDAHESAAAQKAGASLSFSPSTYVVHSRDEEVLRCFLDNPPHLSALDGDAWLDFPKY